MVGIQRQKKYFYWAKRYIDEETRLPRYEKPKKVFLDYEPISSDAQVMALGTDYSNYLQVVGTGKEIEKFGNKDRCYIKIKPNLSKYDMTCNDADYEVSGEPLHTDNMVSLMLKKLSGNEYEI